MNATQPKSAHNTPPASPNIMLLLLSRYAGLWTQGDSTSRSLLPFNVQALRSGKAVDRHFQRGADVAHARI
jgi:hypothetical protein